MEGESVSKSTPPPLKTCTTFWDCSTTHHSRTLVFYFFFISLVWSWLASPLPFQIHHRTHTNRQFLTTRMLVILGLVSLVWINITNIQLKILVDFSFAWIFFFLNKNKWMMAIEMHNSVIKKSIHNWKCACRHEDFK